MRRIKSAPADLCLMCNNIINRSKKNSLLLSKKEIGEKKKQKNILNTSSNIINDVINDSKVLTFEENYLIAFIITYISENIIKKNKLKNLEEFLIQSTIRFTISYLIHNYNIIDSIKHYININ
jgi:hypothetical protein